ncbi:glycosyltransferase [Vibrio parahaemolyticus]|uniref:UDP-Glc:alpha-D-GlcNAc-diphosphoundecaprenol beta-1,3-glucosyltransferase WfgD n=1 Tax=Vibrio parahaemolyticus TaxID=670 RepID=A0A7M1WCV0_VIBPH|nr:glycosyltransferase [Vibrio parahaemolyticus]EJG0872013.1 glycosyltransferase [Vibrio parahaemolyticus O3]EJG0900672.1 glycosyltransferase [Vibrio parahaemolyticus O3:K56]EJG1074956.1 glycosyltransferase [Vibrio parahaemolyticus O1:K56]EGR1973265.1 glycosyltransferase [Vibrio parahaemolyticus]EGR5852641.1 glycosyltransferase [Vibrio parahaemolyticus]
MIVSVYVTTKDRPELLSRALKSVIEQTYSELDIIVVDDGSSELNHKKNHEIVNSLDKKIRYIYTPESKGACYSRNKAIQISKGDFITGLDDDDMFTTNRIESFVDAWDDSFAFICANFVNVYPNIRKYHYKKGGDFKLRDLLKNNEASNQIFTKVERLRAIGGFNVDVKKLQDWDTWLRLCYKYGGFRRLDESTYIMHHDHNHSRVSNNQSYKLALEQLVHRNKDIYDENSVLYIKLLIMVQNGKLDVELCKKSLLSDVSTLFIFKQLTKLLLKKRN